MHKTEKKTPQTFQFLTKSFIRGITQVKKKLYYSKHFICQGVFCIAREEQCLKLQDYVIQKTMRILSSVNYSDWDNNDIRENSFSKYEA